MSTDYSYDIRYTLTDAFGSIIVVDSLSTASVLMDFKAGGTGIGVGKVAETDNLLDVGMNAKFRGTVSGKVASLDGYDSVIASDFNDYKEVGIYIVSISAPSKESSHAPYPSENSSFRLSGGSQETYSMATPSRMSAV